MHIYLANFRPCYSHRKLQQHALKIALKKIPYFRLITKTLREEGRRVSFSCLYGGFWSFLIPNIKNILILNMFILSWWLLWLCKCNECWEAMLAIVWVMVFPRGSAAAVLLLSGCWLMFSFLYTTHCMFLSKSILLQFTTGSSNSYKTKMLPVFFVEISQFQKN